MTENINFSIPAHIQLSVTVSIDPSTLTWFSAFGAKLDLILSNQVKIMATLDDIVADVAAETTSIASVATLIQGLRDQLANAVTGLTPAQQAQIDAVFAGLESNKAALATALQTNVPVASQQAAAKGSPT